MSNAADGRGLAADDFDDDEIDWDDEPNDEVIAADDDVDDDENISPLEQLAGEGDDIFDGTDDDEDD
jgi:hypothetical protein